MLHVLSHWSILAPTLQIQCRLHRLSRKHFSTTHKNHSENHNWSIHIRLLTCSPFQSVFSVMDLRTVDCTPLTVADTLSLCVLTIPGSIGIFHPLRRSASRVLKLKCGISKLQTQNAKAFLTEICTCSCLLTYFSQKLQTDNFNFIREGLPRCVQNHLGYG